MWGVLEIKQVLGMGKLTPNIRTAKIPVYIYKYMYKYSSPQPAGELLQCLEHNILLFLHWSRYLQVCFSHISLFLFPSRWSTPFFPCLKSALLEAKPALFSDLTFTSVVCPSWRQLTLSLIWHGSASELFSQKRPMQPFCYQTLVT